MITSPAMIRAALVMLVLGLVGSSEQITTGTSAEDADSGQVGRGNRVNGLIAHNRSQSSDAAAGKKPMSHVGKIYNVLAS